MPDQEFTLKPIPLVSRAAPQAPSAPSARWALASLSLAMLLSSLGTSIANVGLPTLARAFNAPFQQVQWVVLAYLLATTTLVVSAGQSGARGVAQPVNPDCCSANGCDREGKAGGHPVPRGRLG